MIDIFPIPFFLRRWRWMLLPLVCLAMIALVLRNSPLPREDFRRVQSLRIVDRRGVLLRECLSDGRGFVRWRPLGEIAPSMILATIAVEDRRFFRHPGIDPVAIGRAIVDNLRAMSFRSGGSTITQQVIRNVYNHPRTLSYKFLEAWQAFRLEGMMTKEEILEEYLNRVSYGNLLFGVEAAAQAYFGKPAADLTLAESAYLAGLPNAPSILNPRKNPDAAQVRQLTVLRRLLSQAVISPEDYRRALSQPLQFQPEDKVFRAGHVTDMVLKTAQRIPGTSHVRTTIDYELQQQIQLLMRSHITTLSKKNVTNSSVVVIDNGSGEIRALVGSVDYFDREHSGEVNGALAPRQPGSAIKPLLYGLALEQGSTAADIVPDIPTAFPDHDGDYVPENYDRKFHGPVRLRTALACSYNVPAVRVLRTVGKENFLQRLHEVGIQTLKESAEFYGYGLTLGNGEVTLLELTNAYSALANGGRWKSALLISSAEGPDGTIYLSAQSERALAGPRQVYDERAAFIVGDILRDPVARRPAFGSHFHFLFDCAVKTGTTKDYRDNWTVGYTSDYTVGVWVGNFDGSVMHGVSGISGAGQIFADVMNLLHPPPTGVVPQQFKPPAGLLRASVCAASGKVPARFCRRILQEWFIQGHEPLVPCDVHKAFSVTDRNGRTSTRVYEIYPEEFAEWVMRERVPLPPRGARHIADGSPIGGENPNSSLSIVTPVSGDIYRLDPVLRPEYQTIRIMGSVPQRYRNVRLLVDGTLELPYTSGGVRWKLKRGSHTFQLAARSNAEPTESRPVTIRVE
jgi:penicillin-binding protein 1C